MGDHAAPTHFFIESNVPIDPKRPFDRSISMRVFGLRESVGAVNRRAA